MVYVWNVKRMKATKTETWRANKRESFGPRVRNGAPSRQKMRAVVFPFRESAFLESGTRSFATRSGLLGGVRRERARTYAIVTNETDNFFFSEKSFARRTTKHTQFTDANQFSDAQSFRAGKN